MAKYYEAYEKRYRQVHEKQLSWASNQPSPIVLETIEKYTVKKTDKILELGCGEGRDSIFLLKQGYSVLGTDISKEAIQFCISQNQEYHCSFQVLDICTSNLEEKFDFIYSVGVIHMLVLQEDRDAYLRFIASHLTKTGTALILTMGNGTDEYESGIEHAFENTIRTHQETGQELLVASTSCKVVNFENFERELQKNNLKLIEKGITEQVPECSVMMYGVVQADRISTAEGNC